MPIVSAPDEIRVMVVDDATVVRSLLSRWIDEAPGLKLVAALRNGREAIERLDHARPDVVVLDVEMPELDGISTLPKLLERRRDLAVIMASALTRDHAEVTLKALSLGAADYIPKPAAEGGVMTSATFQRELIEKIRALGVRRRKRPLPPPIRAAPSIRRCGGSAAACSAPSNGEPRRLTAEQSAVQAPPVLADAAARSADRRLDRRAAGADQAGVAARCGHRKRADPDHAAHAGRPSPRSSPSI